MVTLDVVPPSGYFTEVVKQYGDRFKYVRGSISELEDVLAAASANKVDAMVNWAMILSKDSLSSREHQDRRARDVQRLRGRPAARHQAGRLRELRDRVRRAVGLRRSRDRRGRPAPALSRAASMPSPSAWPRSSPPSTTSCTASSPPRSARPSATATAARTPSSCAGSPTSCRCRRWASRWRSNAPATRSSRRCCPTRWASSPDLALKTPSSPHPAYNLGGPPGHPA